MSVQSLNFKQNIAYILLHILQFLNSLTKLLTQFFADDILLKNGGRITKFIQDTKVGFGEAGQCSSIFFHLIITWPTIRNFSLYPTLLSLKKMLTLINSVNGYALTGKEKV